MNYKKEHSFSKGIHLALFIFVCSIIVVVSAATTLPDNASCSFVLNIISFCPYRFFTQTPCPLCGGISASILMLHGDFQGAKQMNPIAFSAAFCLPVQFVYRLVRVFRPAFSLKEEAITASLCVTFAAAALVLV